MKMWLEVLEVKTMIQICIISSFLNAKVSVANIIREYEVKLVKQYLNNILIKLVFTSKTRKLITMSSFHLLKPQFIIDAI